MNSRLCRSVSHIMTNSKDLKKQRNKQVRKYRQRALASPSVNKNTTVICCMPPIKPCALIYAKALTDLKFCYDNGLKPCVPDSNNTRRSQKVVSRMNFTAYGGSNGTAYIAVNPNVYANDLINVIYTNTDYPSADLINFGSLGVIASATSTLPYSIADISSGSVSARTVACEVHVQYSGAPLTRSGIAYGTYPLGLGATLDTRKSADLSQEILTSIDIMDGREHIVRYFPQDTQYDTYVKYDSTLSNSQPCLGFLVNGLPSTPTGAAALKCEVYIAIEYAGPAAFSTQTPSEVDEQARGNILAVVGSHKNGPASSKSYWKEVLKAITPSTKFLKDAAGVVGTGVGAMLSGAAGNNANYSGNQPSQYPRITDLD